MIKLTFEFDSKQAFVDFVKALPDALPPSLVTGSAEVVPAADPEKTARKPRAPKAAAPAPQAAPVTQSEATPTASPAPAAAAPEPVAPAAVEPAEPASPVKADVPEAPGVTAPTQAQAQAAVERVFDAKGFQGAHQLLAQFGVARLRELPAEKYADFIAYADKMVA